MTLHTENSRHEYSSFGQWKNYKIKIILQNNYREIWATFHRLLVAILQNMDNYYSALSVFS